MSNARLLALITMFTLAACTTPPPAEPTVRQTDDTPAPRGVFEAGERGASPSGGDYVEDVPATPPAAGPTRTVPAGGSVRDMIESYPVQR